MVNFRSDMVIFVYFGTISLHWPRAPPAPLIPRYQSWPLQHAIFFVSTGSACKSGVYDASDDDWCAFLRAFGTASYSVSYDDLWTELGAFEGGAYGAIYGDIAPDLRAYEGGVYVAVYGDWYLIYVLSRVVRIVLYMVIHLLICVLSGVVCKVLWCNLIPI